MLRRPLFNLLIAIARVVAIAFTVREALAVSCSSTKVRPTRTAKGPGGAGVLFEINRPWPYDVGQVGATSAMPYCVRSSFVKSRRSREQA